MQNLIGLDVDAAKEILHRAGFDVQTVLYASKRGIDNPDSVRVLRVRKTDEKKVELVVSEFRTRV